MRLLMIALGACLAVSPALSQTQKKPLGPEARLPPSAYSGTSREPSRAESERRSPGPPIDVGPWTPEANRAHRGGGVILEGAPGAPAPPPMPTPPLD